MTRARRSPSTTRSRVLTMFSWVSLSRTDRSRRKRITTSASLASSSLRTLIATVSPGWPGTAASAPAVSRWRARQTVPVAPRPSGSSSRYLLPTGRTSCAPCWSGWSPPDVGPVRSGPGGCRCPKVSEGVPTHCSAAAGAAGRSESDRSLVGSLVRSLVRGEDACPWPLVAAASSATVQAGTFPSRADQSRSLTGGRRACCRRQVRRCLPYWPTCPCAVGGNTARVPVPGAQRRRDR